MRYHKIGISANCNNDQCDLIKTQLIKKFGFVDLDSEANLTNLFLQKSSRRDEGEEQSLLDVGEYHRRETMTKFEARMDLIIILGGDGFMLHSMHKFMNRNIPFYGINCGTVGFLMNKFSESESLIDKISKATISEIKPLEAEIINLSDEKQKFLAINEVSITRSHSQAIKIKISVDGKLRMEEMVGDGVLVATDAGSTAYNLSVHGPVIPLGSKILAITPISPFRPRRWRGALLDSSSEIKFEILDFEHRRAKASADFTEISDIKKITVRESTTKKIQILFDSDHSLAERIITEQFAY